MWIACKQCVEEACWSCVQDHCVADRMRAWSLCACRREPGGHARVADRMRG